jgi:branched-chain amino acid transport system substrate-binding protein
MTACRSRPNRRPIVALVALLFLAGCGLRIPHSEVVAQSRVPAGSSVAQPGTTGGDTGGSSGGSTGSAATGSTGSNAAAGGTTGTSGTTGTTGAAGSSGTSGTGTSGSSSGSGTSTTGSSAAASGTPIIIGTTGAYSGVSNIGTVSRDTLLVWARYVNATGGLDGHPVKVYAEDNGADDNRALAAVQDLVENKKAIAIVALGAGGDIPPFMPYLQRKQVPLVGGFVTSAAWWKYTMAFPDGSYVDSVVHGYDAAVARIAKKKNIAILYCAESQVCQANADVAGNYAPKEGLTVKLKQQVSIAQPDYSSSCIQAQSNGVEAMLVFTDGPTIRRIASSCASQGFHPIFGGLGDNGLASDPNLQGMLNASDTFSWADTSTPAAAQYQKAMSTYGPNVSLSSAGAGAWAAAEEFRAALKGVKGAVTTPVVLAGLWRMKNETLGGLSPGMSFTKGQTAAKNPCFLPLQVTNKKWQAVGKRICLTA